jgi:hypothetical protein
MYFFSFWVFFPSITENLNLFEEIEERIESLRYNTSYPYSTSSGAAAANRRSSLSMSNLNNIGGSTNNNINSNDSTLDTIKEQQRVNQLSLTMNRYRALNAPSALSQPGSGGFGSALATRQTPNPFSALPYTLPPIGASQYTPSLNPTDFIPGLSGQNIYDPNLTADEIRYGRN